MKNKISIVFIIILQLLGFKSGICKGQLNGNDLLKKAFSHKAFSLNFEYTSQSVNNQDKEPIKYLASIFVCGNMYKMTLEDREITCNGDIIWTYFPEENEIQISNHDSELNIWTMLSQYNKFYKVISTKPSIDGKKYIIELAAKDKDNDFESVLVVLNSSPIELEKITITEISKEKHEFVVSDFVSEKPMTQAEFTINIDDYPGALVTQIDTEQENS